MGKAPPISIIPYFDDVLRSFLSKTYLRLAKIIVNLFFSILIFPRCHAVRSSRLTLDVNHCSHFLNFFQPLILVTCQKKGNQCLKHGAYVISLTPLALSPLIPLDSLVIILLKTSLVDELSWKNRSVVFSSLIKSICSTMAPFDHDVTSPSSFHLGTQPHHDEEWLFSGYKVLTSIFCFIIDKGRKHSSPFLEKFVVQSFTGFRLLKQLYDSKFVWWM